MIDVSQGLDGEEVLVEGQEALDYRVGAAWEAHAALCAARCNRGNQLMKEVLHAYQHTGTIAAEINPLVAAQIKQLRLSVKPKIKP